MKTEVQKNWRTIETCTILMSVVPCAPAARRLSYVQLLGEHMLLLARPLPMEEQYGHLRQARAEKIQNIDFPTLGLSTPESMGEPGRGMYRESWLEVLRSDVLGMPVRSKPFHS